MPWTSSAGASQGPCTTCDRGAGCEQRQQVQAELSEPLQIGAGGEAEQRRALAGTGGAGRVDRLSVRGHDGQFSTFGLDASPGSVSKAWA